MEILNENNFENTISSQELTIVDFFANWCMPCRKMSTILEHAEKELKTVKFCKIDIDENEEIAKNYRIFSIPTIIAFKNGQVVDTLVGLKNVNEVVEFANACK